MWHKLILLSLYVLLLFFLSRLLEAAVWYHGDHFFSQSVLDPFSISVTKLRQLLDNRGVSYANVIEKQDLTNLVLDSGNITKQELIDAEQADRTPTAHRTIHFSCGSHFYEEVQDTKDSVWLVQVVADDDLAINVKAWKQVVAKAGRFGVRTGIFKCSLDPRLCSRNGWISPPLIVLALPQRGNFKSVIMHRYLIQPTKLAPVTRWLHKHLSDSGITRIPSIDILKSKWLKVEPNENNILKVIYLSVSNEPPLFLSALAIKFTGRVQFGMFNLPSNKLLGDDNLEFMRENPSYLIVTPEKVLTYGNQIGEVYNYKRMELYLKTLHPEMNDIFLISLFLVNITIGLELFLVRGKLWRHAVRWLLELVKFNCTLFLFWLLLLAAHRFQFVHSFTNFSLKYVRYLAETRIATVVRNDCLFLSGKFVALTFAFFGLCVGLTWKRLGYGDVEDVALFSDWWSVPWDSYIMNYFFRPMATLTRPLAPQEMDLEEGLELFIERLAVPNLWLLPVIQMEYLKELPVWKYDGTQSSQNYNPLSSSSSSDDEKVPKKTAKKCSCFHSFKKLLTSTKNTNRKSKKSKEVLVEDCCSLCPGETSSTCSTTKEIPTVDDMPRTTNYAPAGINRKA